MTKAEEFFAQWLRMREEHMNSDVYKRWLKAKRDMAEALQKDIDEQYPGRTLRTWKAIRDKDGKLAFEVTLKD